MIIQEPIGMKMTMKIIMTVLATLPIVVLISYYIGARLSSKIVGVVDHLRDIEKMNFRSNSMDSNICEFQDINTSANHLSENLEHAIDKLKEHNKQLNLLMTSLAHDIKTPLTISRGYLEEVEDGLIAKEDLPTVMKKLKQENQFINDICNDILSYQQSLEVAAPSAKMNVYNTCNEVCELLQIKIDNKIDKTLYINFAPLDLKKVFLNLLHNAKKFSTGDISVQTEGDQIIIQNIGAPIPKEFATEIFSAYFTVDSSKNRKKSGFGLGLSLVKNLCFRNGYEIRLDTTFEQGARFIVVPKR